MKCKKELLGIGILLVVIPVIFLILIFVNYAFLHDSEQGLGFLISGLVFAVIGIIIFYSEYRRLSNQKKQVINNSFVMMPIHSVKDNEGILEITVSSTISSKTYFFSSSYEVEEDISAIILKKMDECNVHDLNVFIDTSNIKNFEFDIQTFLKNLGLSYSVDLLFTSYAESEE